MSVPKVAAVIGAGTMGPGMAAVLARAGSEVRLYDISDEVLERAKGGYQMATGVLDRVEAASAPGRFGRVLRATWPTALAGAELVLEAIPEKLDLKREVIAQLEDHLADDAIIASNTSGIPITQIATALTHPARFIGMHWSNPPHLIPMIEVVPGEQTAAASDGVDRGSSARSATRRSPRRRCPASWRTGSSTPSCASACPWWSAASSRGGPGHLRQVGHRLQARGDRPDAPARHGRPGHLLQRGLLPQPGPVRGQTEVPDMVREKADAGQLGMKTLGGIYPYTAEQVAERRAEIAKGLIAVRKILSAL